MKPHRQQVLQEPLQKLACRLRQELPLTGIALPIPEGGLAVFCFHDLLRGERDALHVGGQATQRR